MRTLQVLRALLARRDQVILEKVLIYTAYSIKSCFSEINEGNYQSQLEEIDKIAFVRPKADQGRQPHSWRY